MIHEEGRRLGAAPAHTRTTEPNVTTLQPDPPIRVLRQ